LVALKSGDVEQWLFPCARPVARIDIKGHRAQEEIEKETKSRRRQFQPYAAVKALTSPELVSRHHPDRFSIPSPICSNRSRIAAQFSGASSIA